MPYGKSTNWFVGMLFFVAALVISTPSWAADETSGGDASLSATAPADVQAEPQIQPVPFETTNPAASVPATEESECGSVCDGALCSPPGRFWLRTDALMWWTNGTHLPPMVTSNSTGNQPIIGLPGTEVVFGGKTYLNDGRGGARITLGGWLDRCHRWGVEADWFSIAGHSVNYSNTSPGMPATGRPFFNVETNQESAEIVASSAANISGTVSVNDGDSFDSAGFLMRYNLSCGGGCDPCGGCGSCGDELADCSGLCMNYTRTDFLFGFRHYVLNDRLTIREDLADHTTRFRTEVYDDFQTRNEFNGAELGLNTELRRGRWSFNILAKMAIGTNHQITDINGTTTISSLTGSQPTQFYPVGIYAGSTNEGSHRRDEIAVIPQLGLEFGYQISCHWRGYLGYNLIYWGNVMRAADQVDQHLDPRNFAAAPGPQNALPFPTFLDRSSIFWAQGINLGLEFRF